MSNTQSLFLGTVLSLILGVGACNGKETTPTGKSGDTATNNSVTDSVPSNDEDGDGVTPADGDCDDSNAEIYPGREEDCNGIDDNCNDVVDESYGDSDEDGTADCMDSEECDGLDNDGDGVVDEGFEDADGDGEVDCSTEEECNGIDDDEDGEVDEGFDADGDGFTECGTDTGGVDCDDEDADISPATEEVDGDLVDNDCDGLIDESSWAEGDLVITEVLFNPERVSDANGEWFEIYNATSQTVILNGLVIVSDGGEQTHQIASDKVLYLEDDSYAVLGLNEESTLNGAVSLDYVYSDVSLSNESDDLALLANDITIDSVEWDDGATYPDPEGASLTLDPDSLSTTLNDLPEGWCEATQDWDATSDKGSPGAANEICKPIAVSEYAASSTLETCTPVYLDGSDSFDQEGMPLTFDWTLESAPATSNRTSTYIEEVDDESPTFQADVEGIYEFGLVVSNGTSDSDQDTVEVEIEERGYGTDPVADAGTDQTYSEVTATCYPESYGGEYICKDCEDYDFTLDGTASSDADGDFLDEPLWTITSGSSYATITDEDTWAPTITMSGVGADPDDGAETEDVEIQLTVTDCSGATSTDTVTLSYTCEPLGGGGGGP